MAVARLRKSMPRFSAAHKPAVVVVGAMLVVAMLVEVGGAMVVVGAIVVVVGAIVVVAVVLGAIVVVAVVVGAIVMVVVAMGVVVAIGVDVVAAAQKGPSTATKGRSHTDGVLVLHATSRQPPASTVLAKFIWMHWSPDAPLGSSVPAEKLPAHRQSTFCRQQPSAPDLVRHPA